jgi:hypothetical protein
MHNYYHKYVYLGIEGMKDSTYDSNIQIIIHYIYLELERIEYSTFMHSIYKQHNYLYLGFRGYKDILPWSETSRGRLS